MKVTLAGLSTLQMQKAEVDTTSSFLEYWYRLTLPCSNKMWVNFERYRFPITL